MWILWKGQVQMTWADVRAHCSEDVWTCPLVVPWLSPWTYPRAKCWHSPVTSSSGNHLSSLGCAVHLTLNQISQLDWARNSLCFSALSESGDVCDCLWCSHVWPQASSAIIHALQAGGSSLLSGFGETSYLCSSCSQCLWAQPSAAVRSGQEKRCCINGVPWKGQNLLPSVSPPETGQHHSHPWWKQKRLISIPVLTQAAGLRTAQKTHLLLLWTAIVQF